MRIGLGVERARVGRDESHEKSEDDGAAHGSDGVSDGAGAPGRPRSAINI
jgi:hypothetical protein